MAKSHQDELVTLRNTNNLGDTKIYVLFSNSGHETKSDVQVSEVPEFMISIGEAQGIYLICGCKKNINIQVCEAQRYYFS